MVQRATVVWLTVRVVACLVILVLPLELCGARVRGLVLLNAFLVLRCNTPALLVLTLAHTLLLGVSLGRGWQEMYYVQAQGLVSLVVVCAMGVWRGAVTSLPPLDRRHLVTPAKLMQFALALLVVAGLLAALFPPYPPVFGLTWSVLALVLRASIREEMAWPPVEFSVASYILAAVVVVFMLLIGEMGARVLNLGHIAGEDITAPDADYLYRLKPNMEAVMQVPMNENSTEPFDVRTSSLGLRNRELPPKTDREIRILLLGDSYTFGHGVSEANSIAPLLETRLNKWGLQKTFTVVNGGIGGYGPWQSVGTFKRVWASVAPDIVVLQTFVHNDIGDTLRRAGLLLKAFDPATERSLITFRLHGYWEVRAHRWLRARSALYDTYSQVLPPQLCVHGILSACRLTRSIEFDIYQEPALRPWIYEPDLTRWDETLKLGWQMMQEDILELKGLCEEHDIAFGLYNMPWPFDRNNGQNALIPYKDQGYEIDKANKLLEAWAKDAAIPLMPTLANMRNRAETKMLWNVANGHLSPEGSRYFARLLEEFIMVQYANVIEHTNHSGT